MKTSIQPGSAITNTNNQMPKVSMTNILNNQVLHQGLNIGTTGLSSLINIQPIYTGSGKIVNLPPLNGLSGTQQQR